MPIVQPVILLSPPRSGSTLLFDALARSPDLYSLHDESHAVIEGVPALHPAAHGFASNRLTAADATAGIVATLRHEFHANMRDAAGQAPPPHGPVRLLEKTPKNSLRVPFLRAVFPDARFVFLYRDPREVIASMVEAWQSGAFVTYAELPGWRPDRPWSMLLPPGWRAWRDLPPAELAARQWTAAMDILLEDFAALPPAQRFAVRYHDLVAAPRETLTALWAALGLAPGPDLPARLPTARTAITAPAPEKWRQRAAEITAVWPIVANTAARAEHAAAGA